MNINGSFLQELLDDIKTMEVGSKKFSKKYIDFVDNIMVSNKQWRQKVKELKNDKKVDYDAYSLFNEALFLQIPNDNDLFNIFAEKVLENKNDSKFVVFSRLYKQLKELEKSKYDTTVFKKCDPVVQMRAVNMEIRYSDYQQYLDISDSVVQEKVFEENLEKGRIFQYSFKDSQNFIKYKKEIEKEINLELEEKLDRLGGVGVEETFRRCSELIFKRLPDDVKDDFIDIFTKKYTELIKSEQITFEQLQDNLTGEELLELLNVRVRKNGKEWSLFKQENGQVWHLDFDSTKIDACKLVDISKKYKISCSLAIKSCADLPIESIEIMQQHFGIDIKEVRFKQADLEYSQKGPYSIEDYINCRKAIDTIIEDTQKEERVMSDDSDRDKKVCGTISRRLANLIRYNHDYINRSDMKQASEEEDVINRNLIGGLLYGTCVCPGYAEILRNTLACCGIECRYISADNKCRGKDKFGHVWNQVKLDGKWYNLDLTWDADRIAERQPTKYYLKSDKDFGHDEYIPRNRTENCYKSIDNAHKYMQYDRIDQNTNFKRLLRRAIVYKEITGSEVANCESRIASKKEVENNGTRIQK